MSPGRTSSRRVMTSATGQLQDLSEDRFPGAPALVRILVLILQGSPGQGMDLVQGLWPDHPVHPIGAPARALVGLVPIVVVRLPVARPSVRPHGLTEDRWRYGGARRPRWPCVVVRVVPGPPAVRLAGHPRSYLSLCGYFRAT